METMTKLQELLKLQSKQIDEALALCNEWLEKFGDEPSDEDCVQEGELVEEPKQ